MKESSTCAGELMGDRVRKLREERQVTQVILAERTGLRQSHISDLERGVLLPNLLTLMRIAAALDCTVSSITSALDKEDLAALLPK